MKRGRKLDSMALLVSQLVLAAFVGVLLFSESNMPFTATAAKYFDGSGNLRGEAALWGMNTLLEHWAMAIHPPTLFVGYAGLTIPFAYAIAAIIVNDSSKEWVVRSQRYTLFSWLFLGVGIGLGAVWAYVVLGWGGYWGWDPVENASLLSWIVGVALIHSFTVYRQRGAFKRWSVMCACLTFAFVIVGTFISRSGLVQSVHAFEGDPVSLALFGVLIGASILAGIVGLIVRWKSFGPSDSGVDDVENMLSKDAAYYFNNVIMIVFAVLLAYLTVSSALPSQLPFGGQTVSAGTYNAIARPLGVIYLAILAVCPLLSWGRTEGKQFWKRARIPGICAIVLFAVLLFYFITYLLPSYDAILAAGGTEAEGLLEQGPSWYYNGVAVVGLLVASLLFFNSLFMLGRAIRGYQKGHGGNVLAAGWGMLVNRASTFGGFIAHLGMAVILVGLIGSSMYVTEKTRLREVRCGVRHGLRTVCHPGLRAALHRQQHRAAGQRRRHHVHGELRRVQERRIRGCREPHRAVRPVHAAAEARGERHLVPHGGPVRGVPRRERGRRLLDGRAREPAHLGSVDWLRPAHGRHPGCHARASRCEAQAVRGRRG